MSAETAQLLAAALAPSTEFWMNAQSSHDLATHKIETKVKPIVDVG